MPCTFSWGWVNFPCPDFYFTAPDGQVVTAREFRGKVLVLDFWTTSCAICFHEFPKLERLYAEYRDRSDVEVYAVNVPVEGDLPGRLRP